MNGTRRFLLGRGGFTLLEILVSTMMCAILLAAVQGLLYSSLRLREKAEENIQKAQPVQQALATLKRDLAGCVVPGGVLAGAFQGESNGSLDQRRDRVTFSSSTGRARQDAPWGDVQKIEYSLESVPALLSTNQLCLVRAVTRNLLSTFTEEPEYKVLLKGVQSLQLSYYDGETWQDSWDSESQDPPLPEAVQVRIVYAPASDKEEESALSSRRQSRDRTSWIPLELIIPVVAKAPAESATTTEESSGTDEETGPQDGGDPGGGNQGGGNQGGGNQGGGGRPGGGGIPSQGGRPS